MSTVKVFCYTVMVFCNTVKVFCGWPIHALPFDDPSVFPYTYVM